MSASWSSDARRLGRFQAPAGFRLRVVPIPNRWLTIGWHRLGAPIPVDWLAGPMDLYHASDFVLPPVRNARSLLTVHDLSFMTTPQCAEAGLRDFLNRVVPKAVARADHVIADSESTRRDLIRLLGVPTDKVTVVYPGVEPRFCRQDDPAELQRLRARYGIGDGPFILGLGTLEPRKNWPALIRAWAQLRRDNQLAHRLVIGGGKGWLTEGIFEAAEASGFRSEIVFDRIRGRCGSPHALLGRRRFCPSIALRGVWHPGTRGHGLRYTGRLREQLLPARGSGRRRDCWSMHPMSRL